MEGLASEMIDAYKLLAPSQPPTLYFLRVVGREGLKGIDIWISAIKICIATTATGASVQVREGALEKFSSACVRRHISTSREAEKLGSSRLQRN